MSHVSRLGRRACAGSVLTILCVISAARQVTAEQNPIRKLFGDRDVSYKTFKDPAGRFEIEFPDKDWRLLLSGGASLAVFARNDGPALYVDHVRLMDTLTPGEIGALPETEVDLLRKQEPQTKDFKSDMLEGKSGRGVLIKYSRPVKGPASVVQYSVAVGQDLYRLNGVVPERVFSKYEPIIMHMIQSFKALAAPPSPKN